MGGDTDVIITEEELQRRERVKTQEEVNKEAFAAEGAETRNKLMGVAVGAYVRVEFVEVPAELVKNFQVQYSLNNVPCFAWCALTHACCPCHPAHHAAAARRRSVTRARPHLAEVPPQEASLVPATVEEPRPAGVLPWLAPLPVAADVPHPGCQ